MYYVLAFINVLMVHSSKIHGYIYTRFGHLNNLLLGLRQTIAEISQVNESFTSQQ